MQASATRDYLHSLVQNGERLPVGPVIISPDGLFPSLFRFCPWLNSCFGLCKQLAQFAAT